MSTLKDRWLRRAVYPGAYSEASYTGAEYAPGFDTGRGSARESSPPALVRQAREMHATNGIVFACQAVKQALFSEARFQYQKLTDGSTFGDKSLSLLEHPWPNSDSGELLARMCLDGSLGNAYLRKAVPVGGGDPVLVQLRPESVVIISQELTDDMGRAWRQPVGYAEDMGPGREPQFYGTDEIAHFCVDDQTQILTADGWKSVDDLRAGDEALTLNHGTGLAEWQPVSEVCVFPAARREMVLMEGSEHSSLTTPNHRWAVERKNSRQGSYVRRWATSETLSTGDRIPVAAYRAGVPAEAKYTDALTELVAWFWTEGCINRNGKQRRPVSISQSAVVSAENCERIRAALTAVFGAPVTDKRASHSVPRWNEYLSGRNVIFRLNGAAGDVLREHAPGKVPTAAFLRSLTSAQLDLFIKVSLLADNNGPRRLAQRDPAAAEAFALACILAGHAVSIRQGAVTYLGYRMTNVRMLAKRHVYPQESKREGARFRVRRVAHDGRVWCPRTPNQTWLARRHGSVYFTGNSPQPDPKARWRGMSWLTPILADVHSDSRLTAYKTWHIDNGAMPGLVIKYSVKLANKTIETLRKRFKARYGGPENAGNVLVLDEGADMAVAGSTLEQLQYDAVTRAGERRVCAAAGPGLLVIAGFEKGDYTTAIRELADLWARPHWRMLCASLEHLVPGAAANPDVPVRLWYDVSGIAALREGELQRAQAFLVKAQGLASAVAAGFTRDTAVAAAAAGDLSLLKPDPNAPPPGTAARLTGKDTEAPGQPPTGGPAGSIPGRPPQAGRPQQLPGVGKPNLPNALPAGTAAMPAMPAGARGNGKAGAKRSDDAWDGEWPFRGPDGLELDRAGFTEAEHPRIPGGHGGGQFTHSANGGGSTPPPGVLPHPRDTMRGAPPALIAEMDKRLATAQVFTSGKRRGELKRPALPGYRRSVQQIRDEIMATIRAQGTLEQGRAWYPDERQRADARARAYGVRAEQAVGVMSATSPRISYAVNQRVTDEILDAAPKMRDPSALARAGGGSMGQFRDQGLRIAMGEDPARVLRSPKQRSFFNNIMWPGQTADVTVDTWMQDAMARALGITHDQAAMLVSDKTKAFPDSVGYVLVADAVRDAAERMSVVTPGLTPDAVQAAYWIGRQRDAGLPNPSAHEGLTPRGRISQAVGRADALT